MKRWYVVQVYSGYEEVVQKDLLKHIVSDERFGQVLVPSARAKGYFSLASEVDDERLFPGYLLIEMEKSLETINILTFTPQK